MFSTLHEDKIYINVIKSMEGSEKRIKFNFKFN